MRLTKWAARLYPRWWRARYGEEFAALLEDARPGVFGALDVAKGALAMRVSTWSAKRFIWAGTVLGFAVGVVFTTAEILGSPKVSMVLVPHFDFRYTAEAPSILVGDQKMRRKVLAIQNPPVNVLAFRDPKDPFRFELRNVTTHESFGVTDVALTRAGMNVFEVVQIPKSRIPSPLPIVEGIGVGAALGGLMALIVSRRRQSA